MQNRFFMFLGAAVLLTIATNSPSFAEENTIQTYVHPNGRVVFTNLAVDNTPAPPVAATPVLRSERLSNVLADQIPAELRTLVDTISNNHGVDPGLVRAVMKTESNFNRYARSPKGAMGLMQLIPATGRRYGVSDFFDPQQNVEGGVRYLRFLLEKFNGNIDLALAGYNAGENLVQRLGRIPNIPETTNYVKKIRAIYQKESAPVSAPVMLAAALPSGTQPEMAAANAAVKDEAPRIFRVVDERGVVHFSNIEPPN
jgi:soluble lytic murein transglycosylase-like protein